MVMIPQTMHHNELHTYHGIMIADYNRTEYASLEHIYEWMSYCTHHSDMDALETPWYVHLDVNSDFFWH